VADAEQLECLPLESGRSGDEPESGQRGVGRRDGVQADRAEVGEQGAEAVHREVAERQFVTDVWRDDGSFVLLHDLTTCLRIGDATEFKSVGRGWEAYLHEIKTASGRKKSTQVGRQRLAEEAIRDGGPLPGDPDARFVPIGMPYKTHLSMLKDAFQMAAGRGLADMKVPGGRVLVAADLRKGYELWSEEEFLEPTGEAQDRALRRAGLLNVGNHVFYGSDDQAARSPIQPPWAIYPLPPVTCANLIADQAVFTVSSEPLLEALRWAGLGAEWVLPPGQETLQPGQVILRAYKGFRGIEMKPSDMQRLLLELEDLSVWVETVKTLLSQDEISGNHPWPDLPVQREPQVPLRPPAQARPPLERRTTRQRQRPLDHALRAAVHHRANPLPGLRFRRSQRDRFPDGRVNTRAQEAAGATTPHAGPPSPQAR